MPSNKHRNIVLTLLASAVVGAFATPSLAHFKYRVHIKGLPGIASGVVPDTPPAPLTPLNCQIWGTDVPNGYSVTAYANSAVGEGQTCQSESRNCAEGALSGSYAHASCGVVQVAVCSSSSWGTHSENSLGGTLSFGTVPQDENDATHLKYFNIRNTGQVDATITAQPTLGSPYFTVSSGSCALGTVIPPGQLCYVSTRFRTETNYPNEQRNGLINYSINGVPAQLNVTGISVGSRLDGTSTPGYPEFNVPLGTSRVFEVRFTNLGNESATITEAANLTQSSGVVGSMQFSVGTCTIGRAIGPGEYCASSVTFTPTNTVATNAAVRLKSTSLTNSGNGYASVYGKGY